MTLNVVLDIAAFCDSTRKVADGAGAMNDTRRTIVCPCCLSCVVKSAEPLALGICWVADLGSVPVCRKTCVSATRLVCQSNQAYMYSNCALIRSCCGYVQYDVACTICLSGLAHDTHLRDCLLHPNSSESHTRQSSALSPWTLPHSPILHPA